MDPLPFFGPLRHDGDTLNNGNTRIYTLHIFLFQKTSVIEGSRGGGGFCSLAHGLLLQFSYVALSCLQAGGFIPGEQGL